MRKLVVFSVALMIAVSAATVATYVRYQSFDACDWIAQDMAGQTSLPVAVWEGKVRAEFLLRGITNPDPGDCILAWWEERAVTAKNGH